MNPNDDPNGDGQRVVAPNYEGLQHLRRLRGRRAGPELCTLSVDLTVVTPILGGAPQTRSIDDVDVIRPASVRGHLRFWWRALYGHQEDPARLYEAEGDLWGKATTGDEGGRSQVELRIQIESTGDPLHTDVGRDAPGAYALWTARGQFDGTPPAPRRQPGTQFKLKLVCPQARAEEVRNVVRAWVLFGGYGGRTRRGLGSLVALGECQSWLPVHGTRDALTALFGADVFESRGPTREMPRLAGASLLLGRPTREADKAWRSALGWLEEFRQGTSGGVGHRAREPGRAPQPRRPSISNWPEADKVRVFSMLAPGRSWAHPPRHSASAGAWPRAGFGLPIIGRFQRRSREPGPGGQGLWWLDLTPPMMEPPNFELRWKHGNTEHDRLASSLIVKALPLANGRFAPCVLWLDRALPNGAVVGLACDVPGGGWAVDTNTAAPFDTLSAPGDTPRFAPLAGATTLREAFLGWVRTTHGVKVVAP